MLLLKTLSYLCLVSALTLASFDAKAGLSGFHKFNKYTKEERILNLKEVPFDIPNYRAFMRNNLLMLIRYAKEQNKDFKIITHEGQELLTKSLWEYDREGYNRARNNLNAQDDSFLFHKNFSENEPLRYTDAYEYLHLVDAVAINNLYCGKGHESKVTKKHNLGKITIEHCNNAEDLDMAQIDSISNQKISYGFTKLDNAFNNIDNKNKLDDSSKNVFEVADASNILILDDDSRYTSKDQLVSDLLSTNYDIIIIKPLFHFSQRFSKEDISHLGFKKNGSKRLLIAELNVSEANPKEYYWHNDWKISSPSWLFRKSFSTQDSIITQYWHPEWKKIISNYFKDIVNEGFDGIFFTGIENHKYFEQQTPLE